MSQTSYSICYSIMFIQSMTWTVYGSSNHLRMELIPARNSNSITQFYPLPASYDWFCQKFTENVCIDNNSIISNIYRRNQQLEDSSNFKLYCENQTCRAACKVQEASLVYMFPSRITWLRTLSLRHEHSQGHRRLIWVLFGRLKKDQKFIRFFNFSALLAIKKIGKNYF